MISMVRIDDRLIHGQVAFVWTKHLGVNRIIVANDSVAKNDIQKMSLKMAVPDTIKCSILTLDEAINVLNDPRGKSLKILIVVNNPADARKIIEKVDDVPYVNISNYGLLSRDISAKRKVTDTIYATEDDIEEFNKIFKYGKRVEYQVVPTSPVKSLEGLLK
ncbi:PTS system mannose/fructose/N-acetylgalactosamine-transporter subunit IIB [Clostridium beijerinckii]|uniref:PTS system mannose-specific IIB component n=1 Tax=Clostridium beijerinckii TaxID=1520 RepID=A0AAX0AW76_CLOBE|nr:PTS sugar transporter subunit IIB [Clostridium beijerinckii]MBA8933882.1 PTS system mannose-specific IIB component [Clostridium beijerinckii]NOW05182.1 PTS system mannose-specific IIB component [Clostridium beijerinckii]NRT86379.1 PTS system mannose-specific IIB component [Clostridium beijerinckii]NRU38076.1 PTS system mannose-specific IIB component [Clostridium beijerinckii]NRZ21641.1 PTS system mannose-specific IIB component [Clostridium beijerinckii]